MARPRRNLLRKQAQFAAEAALEAATTPYEVGYNEAIDNILRAIRASKPKSG